MRGYLQLIRPLNAVMAAVAVFIAALIASTFEIPNDKYMSLYFAIATVFFFMAAGNTLNDYYDRDIDKVNHPERPIPSGRAKPKNALYMAGILFGIAIALSYFINLKAMALVLINLGLIISYELFFKNRGLSGNAVIGWLTATLFLFGGLAVYVELTELIKVATLGLLAFMATLGREIVKDIQDIKGDMPRRTLPKRIGVRPASYIAALIFIATSLMSILPLWLGLFEFQYILLIIIADVIFIYCGIFLFQNPRGASNLAKVGMVMALVAFMFGGIGV